MYGVLLGLIVLSSHMPVKGVNNDCISPFVILGAVKNTHSLSRELCL